LNFWNKSYINATSLSGEIAEKKKGFMFNKFKMLFLRSKPKLFEPIELLPAGRQVFNLLNKSYINAMSLSGDNAEKKK